MTTSLQAPVPAIRTGIILFAHGSRDPLWRLPIEEVARRIGARQPDTPVGCAYLELNAPDLATCATDLIGQGAGALRIVPMFLGVGRHAREDLPQLVESLRTAHPGVAVSLMPSIGEDTRLLDLVTEMALEG